MALPNDTSDLSDQFFIRWADAFKTMGVDPMVTLKVCMSESNCFPGAHNPYGDASGIIQFMPETLKYLKFPGTWRDMVRLRAEDQVPWAAKYFSEYSQYLTTPALAYVATFLPSQTKAASESGDVKFHLCSDKAHGGKLTWAYIANPDFDVQHKGWIDVQDLANRINRICQGPRWENMQKRMQAAIDGTLIPQPSAPTTPSVAIANIAGDTLASQQPESGVSKGLIIGLALGAVGLYVGWKAFSGWADEQIAEENREAQKVINRRKELEHELEGGAFIARNDNYAALVRATKYWKDRGDEEKAKNLRIGYLRERARLNREDPEAMDRMLTREQDFYDEYYR